ncbi:PD-(D/E)XK nuclease family protein [uncultured Desulfuromonas sp.]|uniref:PD-(D/E)XK nuclease family protein n=1 Tax=uncultured Desulfuromonas sp. TaxID=181013 RepID=UPI002AAC2BE9|nr:PD-(D/E)XK nuclease family protein [uncultured Desulfuromonas sp.]
MLYPPEHSIWSHLAAGDCVITVNRRLARTLAADFAEYCAMQQLSVWETPMIFPVNEWFERELARLDLDLVLLDSSQVAAVWDQVIEEDLHHCGVDLLQVPATVRQAVRADSLCCDYLVDCYVPEGVEQEAFLRWRQCYEARCHEQKWLDRARLPEVIERAVSDDRLTVSNGQIWLGFDDLTPLLRRMQQTLTSAGCTIENLAATRVDPVAFDAVSSVDEPGELQAAARWARQRLEQQVGVVAVVVPELERLQGDVQRIFFRELSRSDYPDRVPVDTFNMSLGHPLADQGMIAAALTLLQLHDSLDFDQLSYLLRCPWFAGGRDEWQQRVLFERQLRADNVLRLSVADLLYRLRHQPQAPQGMLRLVEQLQRWQGQQEAMAPADWVEQLNSFLQQIGWPGDASLDSHGYQVFAAWQDKVLTPVARLGVVSATMTRSRLSSWVQRLSREILFQPKAQDHRLQIIGLLETAGLTFDALWLCGAGEQVFPGGLSFNPFLPTALQKQCQMPHSDLLHEARYARLLLERLQHAAQQVVISYAQNKEEQPCRCSPYLTHLCWQSSEEGGGTDRDRVPLESFDDGHAPSLTAAQLEQPLPGGTGLLKEQAQCPFKAFIHYRVGVRALDVPQPGLTSRRRGDLLHRVLQQVWQGLGSHAGLLNCDETTLRQLVAQQVVAVLDGTRFSGHERALLAVEKQRLEALVHEWLDVERQREPFSVQSVEERQLLQVGPLRLNTIPDRIDVTDDGRMIVLDYKTGQVAAGDLVGEVLFEPQLPVYALHGVQGEVAAVSFAQVRHGHCAFKGVSAEEAVLPGVRSVERSRGVKSGLSNWNDLIDHWRQHTQWTAQAIVDGDADVTPVHAKVCRFCDLKGLCRIDLQRVEALEGEDEA